MVATFHLHCLGHRIKYGNLEVGNTTHQLLSATRPCCSIQFIESFLFWVILVTYNVGIYICIYIYKVSYIHSFFVIFNCNVFSALHAKHFEIWKNILWNDESIASRQDPSSDVMFPGVHSEFMFPFMEFFFLNKTVFPLVFLSLAYYWVNQVRYFW